MTVLLSLYVLLLFIPSEYSIEKLNQPPNNAFQSFFLYLNNKSEIEKKTSETEKLQKNPNIFEHLFPSFPETLDHLQLYK